MGNEICNLGQRVYHHLMCIRMYINKDDLLKVIKLVHKNIETDFKYLTSVPQDYIFTNVCFFLQYSLPYMSTVGYHIHKYTHTITTHIYIYLYIIYLYLYIDGIYIYICILLIRNDVSGFFRSTGHGTNQERGHFFFYHINIVLVPHTF